MKIVKIPPVTPTYTIEGLDEDTCIALRTILYNIEGKRAFPGLEELSNRLQIEVGGLARVEMMPGGFNIKRIRE